MSLGLPARCAVVCALAMGAGAAHAEERRVVAVVDLTGGDLQAKGLANAVYDQLQIHWALRALGDPSFTAALLGEFVDEDAGGLAVAATARQDSDEDLLQFRADEAVSKVTSGLTALTSVTPARAAPLAADLALSAGFAELALRQKARALEWFALVHRLAPGRTLDPVRYDPEQVSAFKKAEAAAPARHELSVKGSGQVWIDGVDVGAAPGAFDVADGKHLVQLAGPGRQVRGRLLVATDKAVEIEDAPADPELEVKRARRVLATAPASAVDRAPAMKALAELLGVHDAVLMWKDPEGKLLVQTWRDQAPGFSALREHTDEPPLDLLAPLAPPKPPEPKFVEPPGGRLPKLPKIEPEVAWYNRNWVRASITGGVVVAIVGVVLIAQHQSHITVDMNGQWATP